MNLFLEVAAVSRRYSAVEGAPKASSFRRVSCARKHFANKTKKGRHLRGLRYSHPTLSPGIIVGVVGKARCNMVESLCGDRLCDAILVYTQTEYP